MLTSREIQTFHEQGFLAVRGAIEPPALDRLRRVADEMLERSRDVPAGGDMVFDVAPDHTPQSPRLNRINHPVVQDIAFAEVATGERILDIVCALLGQEVKFHHSKLNMKIGGGGAEIGWHQDYAFFPHTRDGGAWIHAEQQHAIPAAVHLSVRCVGCRPARLPAAGECVQREGAARRAG